MQCLCARHQQYMCCSLSIGACRPGHTQALAGLFRTMRTHITRTGREDTWSPAYSICMHRRTYSVQCSDKICFLQLRIKCSVAKSCPGTHTALQAPMSLRLPHDNEASVLYVSTWQRHMFVLLYGVLSTLFTVIPRSLVPRCSKNRRERLVHTVHACAKSPS